MAPSKITWLAALIVVSTLTGCIDAQRIREVQDEAERIAVSRYYARRAADARDLAARSPCCEPIATLEVTGRVDGAREYRATLGVWPSRQATAFDGERSYYALLTLDPARDERQTLIVRSSFSALALLDPETRETAYEIFVPVVRFLAIDRSPLSTVVGAPVQTPSQAALHSRFTIPPNAAFALIYTNRQALELRGMRGSMPTQYSAYGGVAIRTPARTFALLPSITGTITINMGD